MSTAEGAAALQFGVQHHKAAGGVAGGWVQALQPPALWWLAEPWWTAASRPVVSQQEAMVAGDGAVRGKQQPWLGRCRGRPPLVDAHGRYAPGRRPELDAGGRTDKVER